jgi:endoglucanase
VKSFLLSCVALVLGLSITGCADAPPCTGAAGACGNVGPRVLTRRGVSLSGAEFGFQIPGVFDVDYTYPMPAEIDYYVSKGMTEFRIPFLWERLQPTLGGPLNEIELGRLDGIVNYALSKNVGVLLDPHNYARYNNGVIGGEVPNTAFADFWSKVADHYKGSLRVDFGLMNEPHDMPTEQWVDAANAAIQAIRATGATNLIAVPGNAWEGAKSWSEGWYGTANSAAMLSVVDPGNNIMFEAHQYLDADSSGSDPTCGGAKIGADRMAPFTSWLRANHKKGFLGEFATGSSPICLEAVDNMLKQLDDNADVYMGWTWWGAGPWWGAYPFSIEPAGATGDRPQMDVLTKHL